MADRDDAMDVGAIEDDALNDDEEEKIRAERSIIAVEEPGGGRGVLR